MPSDSYKRQRRCGTGFTLPEATVAMVILGMAAAGVLLPFADGASVQAEGMHRSLAASLANNLLERIVNTPFNEIVDKYNYAEEQGQVKDASGTTFTDPIYANYSREVTSKEVYVPQESGPPIPENFILASVRVYYRGQQIAAVHRLISR